MNGKNEILLTLKELGECEDFLETEFGRREIHPGDIERYARYSSSMMGYEGEAAKQWESTIMRRVVKGTEYKQRGYVLLRSHRHIKGLRGSIPKDAIEWEYWPAGYVATAEAERLLYVVNWSRSIITEDGQIQPPQGSE